MGQRASLRSRNAHSVPGIRLALASMILALSATVPVCADAQMSYLDNGVIRLGVDLDKGGTITYLSRSLYFCLSLTSPALCFMNVINSHDLGREVTAAYYAGPPNFLHVTPPHVGWWNPDPAGDDYGNTSAVLAHSNDGLTIYTQTLPLQWPVVDVPCECVMEQWIKLDGNSVRVHNRLTNNRSDHIQYGAARSGLPAAYTNGPFWRLFTYTGSSPYTGGPLTQIGGWDVGFSATEHWAALVDDSGFGLGVFNPWATTFAGGVADIQVGGTSDNPTSTVFPNIPEILDWNIIYEFDYTLVLGTLDQIRSYAVTHHQDDRPDYHFAHDRQHFRYANATDSGWPISGALHINLDRDDPYIIGPEQWWQAQDVPRVYITAAYHTSSASTPYGQVFWNVPGQNNPDVQTLRFPTIPDGSFHTYTVDLASLPAYQGTITGIRFDPSDGNDPGGYVDIASITWKAPDLANYQGLWWASPAGSESGWGINFAHQGDIIFATWFTYDASGKAWWLSMTATKSAPGTYSGPVYATTGPAFSAVPFDPSQVKATAVGNAVLIFSDSNNGSFSYTVKGIAQEKAITRQVFGPLPSCATTGGSLAAATNYQDLWWAAPAGTESGWGINLTQEGDTIFGTWFTYDTDHTPLWLSVTAPRTRPWVYSGTLYRTTGPAFNAVPFDPAKVVATAVGTATFTFNDGNNASFAYAVNGVSQVKAITRQVFQNPGTACQ